MLRKNVELLLERLQVCIFAEIVFGVRCTLTLSVYFINKSIPFVRYYFISLLKHINSLTTDFFLFGGS